MQRQLIDFISGLFPLKALSPREGYWRGGQGEGGVCDRTMIFMMLMVETQPRILIATWKAKRLKGSSLGSKNLVTSHPVKHFSGTVLAVAAPSVWELRPGEMSSIPTIPIREFSPPARSNFRPGLLARPGKLRQVVS